jgi:RNA polymerase sigma-70 factor, ECF subfamily
MRRRPAQYPTGADCHALLGASARRTSIGPASAEDAALQMLPDSDIQAPMLAVPEKFPNVVYYADVQGLR